VVAAVERVAISEMFAIASLMSLGPAAGCDLEICFLLLLIASRIRHQHCKRRQPQAL
jgi:hypothetical protein